MFRLLYVNRFYHTSQSLVSKYPISKWNLSLRILTRIEIHNIIIEKNLSRSIIKFFSSIFRVGKCFSQFWEKKIEEIRIRTGAEFLPKIEPPPPPKKKPTDSTHCSFLTQEYSDRCKGQSNQVQQSYSVPSLSDPQSSPEIRKQ